MVITVKLSKFVLPLALLRHFKVILDSYQVWGLELPLALREDVVTLLLVLEHRALGLSDVLIR